MKSVFPVFVLCLALAGAVSGMSIQSPTQLVNTLAVSNVQTATVDFVLRGDNETQDVVFFVQVPSGVQVNQSSVPLTLGPYENRVISEKFSGLSDGLYTANYGFRFVGDGSGMPLSQSLAKSFTVQVTGFSNNSMNISVNLSGPVCGNGVVEAGEYCDRGGANGACPAVCNSVCGLNVCSSSSGESGGGSSSGGGSGGGGYVPSNTVQCGGSYSLVNGTWKCVVKPQVTVAQPGIKPSIKSVVESLDGAGPKLRDAVNSGEVAVGQITVPKEALVGNTTGVGDVLRGGLSSSKRVFGVVVLVLGMIALVFQIVAISKMKKEGGSQ
jgi:hypothetical protein